MQSALSLLMISLLAFGFGYATQRGNVCGWLAARQIVETGKASRLVAFGMAALWALAIVVPLSWLTRGSFVLSPSHDAITAAGIGGALFGLGTAINGGCMFGTVSRLTSGKLSYLMTLPGIALGAGVGMSVAIPRLAFAPVPSPLSEPSLGGVALLLVAAGLVGLASREIVRTHQRAGLHLGQVLRAARWRTSVAMLVIGVLGGLLFATGASWSYMALLHALANLALNSKASLAAATLVGPLGMLAGAMASAGLGGRFVLEAPNGGQVGRSLVGGALMGFAATIVPGGNDALLLSALPSLAWHGVVAYLSMLGAQLVLAALARRWKRSTLRGATRDSPAGGG